MAASSSTDSADQVPLRILGVELVAASFVVLFQELALIRWLPSQVRVIAYFPNVVLIAAFLGLGVGALRAKARSLLWLWPASLLTLVLASIALSGVAFTANSVSEHLWLLYADLPEGAPVVEGVELPIIGVFVLAALSFVALGQIVAIRLNAFRARSTPLRGYALDLTGSLLGVVGFAVASFARTFPVVWFGAFALAGSVLFLRRRALLPVYALVAVVALFAIARGEKGQRYSPYYSLSTVAVAGTDDHIVRTNGSLHQVAVALARSDPAITDQRAQTRDGYHLPYRVLGRAPGRVLVLGAGTGNDVAVALDEGAEAVDAVEIDPVIVEYGRELHPNRPYADPRVTVVNTDARSFLNDTDATYDLIVFGTLDSMTRLSALSNVRLDNFVYTRDAIAAAARHLAPDGGAALYFMVGQDYIDLNLGSMLTQVFGRMPVIAAGNWNLFNRIYLTGPAFASAAPEGDPRRAAFEERARTLSIPTDDWPYLYLEGRGVSRFYLVVIAALLAISVCAVLLASRDMRSGLRDGRSVDGEMFLFGVAFLLMETRFVTVMNLAWGATWVTSAVVFGAILAVVLAGTLLMDRVRLPWQAAMAGLLGSLLLSWTLSPDLLVSREMGLRLLLSLLYVGVPIFFASACFAIRFARRTSTDLAFGWNLLGAVAGGLTEFLSMAIGLRALTLIVIAGYLGVYLLSRAASASPVPAADLVPSET